MPGQRRCFLAFLVFFSVVARAGDTLRIAIPTYPARLNPVYATDETSQAVLNKIHQALFAFDADGRVVNELAESVRLDESGLSVDIRLRPGIRFSSGSELQAGDVEATFRLLGDPAYEYPYLSDLTWLKELVAIDRYRLKLRLASPYAPWRNYLTFKILSAAEIRRLSPQDFRRSSPIGCGWYKLGDCEAPLRLRLERNPFRPARGLYPRLDYSVLLDFRQAPLKLLSGETDAAELFSEDLQTFSRMPEWQRSFQLIRFRKFGYLYLVFNLRRPAVDVDLRRSLRQAIVEGSFLDRFLNGEGCRVGSPFLLLSRPPSGAADPLRPASPRDPLTLLCNSETPLRRNLSLFICAEMKRRGIELEPRFLEYQIFLSELKKGDFDLAISGFLLDLDWNLHDVLASDGSLNYAGYRNPEMDRCLAQGLIEMDEKRRRQIYLQAHRCWARDLPFLPLFTPYSAVGVARHVRVPDRPVRLMGSTGDFFYNIQDWRR